MEMKMAGSDKPITSKGVHTANWDCDQWILVEHEESTLGDQGKVSSVGIWSWDSEIKKFRVFFFDSYGITGSGTARYDAPTKTWRFNSKSRMGGETSVGEGAGKMVDQNTMEWNWTEWDAWKCKKFMEGKGTSHRK